MGDSPEIIDTDNDLETQVEEIADEGTEAKDAIGDDSDAGATDEDTGFEVVIEGDTGSLDQDQVNAVIRKRLSKLNNKVTAAREEQTQSAAEAERLRRELDVYKFRVSQLESSPKPSAGPPNPDDFDGGTGDPAYVSASNTYFEEIAQRAADKRLTESSATAAEQESQKRKARDLEKKQIAHYQRADKLGARDYEAKEDVAIAALGQETANHIIDNFDDSHVLFYYLGANPAKAEKLAELIATNPIRGVAEIGRLQASIKVRPKLNPAPEPDEEIRGSRNSSGRTVKGAVFR